MLCHKVLAAVRMATPNAPPPTPCRIIELLLFLPARLCDARVPWPYTVIEKRREEKRREEKRREENRRE